MEAETAERLEAPVYYLIVLLLTAIACIINTIVEPKTRLLSEAVAPSILGLLCGGAILLCETRPSHWHPTAALVGNVNATAIASEGNGSCVLDVTSSCYSESQRSCLDNVSQMCNAADSACFASKREACRSPSYIRSIWSNCQDDVNKQCGAESSKLAWLLSGGVHSTSSDSSSDAISIDQGFQFSASTFFNFALPPIIFVSGLELQRDLFVRNLPTILLHGIVGTLMSFALIAIGLWLFVRDYLPLQDRLVLGAILSSTDTVAVAGLLDSAKQPLLYSAIMGEGIMNDLVSIGLQETLNGITNPSAELFGVGLAQLLLMFLSAIGLGIVAGAMNLLVTRKLLSHSSPTESWVLIIISISFASHLLAESVRSSGVAAIFTAAVVTAQWALAEMPVSANSAITRIARAMASLASLGIYVTVGLDVFDLQKWEYASFGTTMRVFSAFALLTVFGRILCIVPLATAQNVVRYMMKSSSRLRPGEIAVVAYAGLTRGSVAVALTYRTFANASGKTSESTHATIITCMLLVFLLTAVLLGTMTKSFIEIALEPCAHLGNFRLHARSDFQPGKLFGFFFSFPTFVLSRYEESLSDQLQEQRQSASVLPRTISRRLRGVSEDLPETRTSSEMQTYSRSARHLSRYGKRWSTGANLAARSMLFEEQEDTNGTEHEDTRLLNSDSQPSSSADIDSRGGRGRSDCWVRPS